MTSSIPDGISFSDLDALRQNAPTDDEAANIKVPTFDGKTQNQVEELASNLVQEAIDKCNDPMIHKAMMIEMLENMIRWHSNVGVDQEDDRSTVCWLRDGGKFQAICNILTSISLGPDDFLMD